MTHHHVSIHGQKRVMGLLLGCPHTFATPIFRSLEAYRARKTTHDESHTVKLGFTTV